MLQAIAHEILARIPDARSRPPEFLYPSNRVYADELKRLAS
jgi:hypothetical protein